MTPLLLVIAWYCTVLPCAPCCLQTTKPAHSATSYCCVSERLPCGARDVILEWNEYSVQFWLVLAIFPYCQFSVCSSWRWKSRTLGPSAGSKPYRWITNTSGISGLRALIARDFLRVTNAWLCADFIAAPPRPKTSQGVRTSCPMDPCEINGILVIPIYGSISRPVTMTTRCSDHQLWATFTSEILNCTSSKSYSSHKLIKCTHSLL